MNNRVFLTCGNTPAIQNCALELERRGQLVTDDPSGDVTHLVLPIPSTSVEGSALKKLLGALPATVTVFGGYLDRPDLRGFRCRDLLQDEIYLTQNAAITAHCAVAIAAQKLSRILPDCSVLVIGWGRIGKCLARLLKCAGAAVTVAARNPKDRALLTALGYEAEDPAMLGYILRRYRVIFNTVPYPVLSQDQMIHCRPECLKIDLASTPGIASDDVIHARGLPGKNAPESAGKLMAASILRLCAQGGRL